MMDSADDSLARETALKIIGLSDRGEITLTGVETIIREFMARGRAAQVAVDQILAAEDDELS